ncbi:hypothetical protein N9283_04230 [Akkermansiaceae bacterium]|nr:hypothetical protein [Akkermansiaceae bacterium]MDB4504818.1 hypothetical protein [Akkermansiaceae bacterium]MDB4725567.1 hypothetical protein [Akkermansiaceae bacterium]
MIYSLIIAALILGIAAFFGIKQSERLADLETRWLILSEKAEQDDVPIDPAEPYALDRLSHRSSPAARKETIGAFGEKLIAFMNEVREAEKEDGASNIEIQQRGIKLLSELNHFSGSEIELLVERILSEEGIEESSKNELVTMSIMMLSQDEPETALSLFLETKDRMFIGGAMDKHFIGTAVASLAKRDPRAAVDWLITNKDAIGELDDGTRVQILEGAAGNMNGAFDIIDELGFENKSRAFGVIGSRVTAESLPDFLKVIRAEKDPLASNNAFSSLAKSPFAQNIEKATSLLEGGKLSSQESRLFLDGLDYHSLKEGTSQWLDWMADGGKKYSDMSESLIRDWTRNDYRAAGEWVNSVDEGPKRDRAKAAYARTLAEHEPAGAAVWAESLPKGAQQNKVRAEIYRYWKKSDPAAASAYGQKHGLGQ